MKIVIISDTHGRSDLFDGVLRLHRDRDGLIFLGDGVRDIPDECGAGVNGWFAGVRGNCDGYSFRGREFDLSEELLLNIGEYTVIMMHGHTRSVKSGIERAAVYASERGADILLFGHTHEPIEKYYPEGTQIGEYTLKKPLWVFNPGSLGAPKDGEHSYGLMQIKRGQLLLSHGKIK